MLVDTHCHLHDPQWFTAQEQSEFLQNASEQGVKKIICIGTNHADSLVAQDFASQHPDVFYTYGIHPEFAARTKSEIEQAKAWLKKAMQKSEVNSPVAIGEIGLDYHYDDYDRNQQLRLFEEMLQLAGDYQLPVSLHIREAFDDAFAVLDNFSSLCGVIHSFTGSKRNLKKALERGFYIGVNGLITYNTIALPPLDRMLLETDAPFLTPVPYRGKIKTNQPAYVKAVMVYLAQQMPESESKIVEQTTRNARNLFKI